MAFHKIPSTMASRAVSQALQSLRTSAHVLRRITCKGSSIIRQFPLPLLLDRGRQTLSSSRKFLGVRNFYSNAGKLQSVPQPKPKPLSHLKDNFLDGTSSVYLEELQRMWEKDPSSVDESWQIFFRNFTGDSLGTMWRSSTLPALSAQEHSIQESMRLLSLVRAYQVNGHMKATLDPLGMDNRKKPPELELAAYNFTEQDLDKEFFHGVWQMSGFLAENRPMQSLRTILQRLEQAYCGTTGYEYMHIPDREKCNWLRERIETKAEMKYSTERKSQILDRLMWSTNFENFLAQKWTAAKRFGLEGCETLIPGKALLEGVTGAKLLEIL